MSTINQSCGCGGNGFNFLPASSSAVDCFYMQKVAQLFSGSFTSVTTTLYIDELTYETPAVLANGFRTQMVRVESALLITPPVAPYTFVSAQNTYAPAIINSIVQLPPLLGQTNNLYQVSATAIADLSFVDSVGTTYLAKGHIDFLINIATTLTYEELVNSGIANALICFESLSGTYLTDTTFSVVVFGDANMFFTCPAMLRMEYQGECSFMTPPAETLNVINNPPVPLGTF